MTTINPQNVRYAWRRLVVRDPHLTDATRRVLLELESYTNPDGTNAHPGIERIAAELLTKAGTVNEKTVRRALETGVKRGYIECTRKGGGGRGKRENADTYRLTLPLEEPGPWDRVEEGDSGPLDAGDSEPGRHRHRSEQTAETVDTQVSGVRTETVATNSPPALPDSEPASNSPTRPSAPPAAGGRADESIEPPRFCHRHPNDTTERCRDCRDAREKHERWQDKQDEEARDRRVRETRDRAEARNDARATCTLCAGKSEAEKDCCFHDPDSVEAWRRNRFPVRAALPAPHRAPEQGVHTGGGTTSTRNITKPGRRPTVPKFKSGNSTGRAAALEELRSQRAVPVPAGPTPGSGAGAATKANSAPAA